MVNNAPVTGEYSASVSPSIHSSKVSSGAYITPYFEVTTQNGVGPFEYLWTYDGNANVSISSATSKRTNFTISSYSGEADVTVNCEVTDKGNADAKVSASAEIFIIFGNFL